MLDNYRNLLVLITLEIGPEPSQLESRLQRLFFTMELVVRFLAYKVYTVFVGVTELLPEILGWLIVMFLLVPIGFIMTILLLPFAIIVKRGTRKVADALESRLKSGHKINIRQAMTGLAKIQRERTRTEEIVELGKAFFVVRPINSQFSKISSEYKRIEALLEPFAYPNREPITTEDAKELSKAFKGWEGDWMDKKMEVYNQSDVQMFEPGDVVTCPFPFQDNPLITKPRPALILSNLGNNKFRIAQITTTNRSGQVSGEFVHKSSAIGKAMGIRQDSFINLSNITDINGRYLTLIGHHPFIDSIEGLCKQNGISLH